MKRTIICAGHHRLESGDHVFEAIRQPRRTPHLGDDWALCMQTSTRHEASTMCVVPRLADCIEIATDFVRALDAGWVVEEASCRMMGVIYRVAYLIQARGQHHSTWIVPAQYGGWYSQPGARWHATLDEARLSMIN